MILDRQTAATRTGRWARVFGLWAGIAALSSAACSVNTTGISGLPLVSDDAGDSGGRAGAGGAPVNGTGGAIAGTGGVVGTGGDVGAGGDVGSGGVVATGGVLGAGGVSGTGGDNLPGMGGLPGNSGGSGGTAVDALPPDTSMPDVPSGMGLGIGALCHDNAACASHACVDGVCCETACAGTCMACTGSRTGGLDGQCRPVMDGTDPDSECAADQNKPCGNTGRCSAGRCEVTAAGEVCGDAKCLGSTFTPPPQCNGTGTCVSHAGETCPDNRGCGPDGSCLDACKKNTDCTGGTICDLASGICRAPAPLGESCNAVQGGKDCASGHCADGICCDTACTGTCTACTKSRTGANDGVCAPVKSGIDPDNECAVEAKETCGRTGACNGAGACATYPDGTECGATCCDDGPGQGHSARPCLYLCRSGRCDKNTPVPTGAACGGLSCCCQAGDNAVPACTLALQCAGTCR